METILTTTLSPLSMYNLYRLTEFRGNSCLYTPNRLKLDGVPDLMRYKIYNVYSPIDHFWTDAFGKNTPSQEYRVAGTLISPVDLDGEFPEGQAYDKFLDQDRYAIDYAPPVLVPDYNLANAEPLLGNYPYRVPVINGFQYDAGAFERLGLTANDIPDLPLVNDFLYVDAQAVVLMAYLRAFPPAIDR